MDSGSKDHLSNTQKKKRHSKKPSNKTEKPKGATEKTEVAKVKPKLTPRRKRIESALRVQAAKVAYLRQLKSKKREALAKKKAEKEGQSKGEKRKAEKSKGETPKDETPKGEQIKKKKKIPDSEAVPKFPPVPESFLRRRKHLARIKEHITSNLKKRKRERKRQRAIIYKRARQYLEEYKTRDRELITLRRMARNSGSFYREPEPKLAIVIRIRGINGVDPKTKSILRILRLRQNSKCCLCQIECIYAQAFEDC